MDGEPLCTIPDVEVRLGREVTEGERPRVETLIIDASAIVRAWVRCPIPVPTPEAVAGVVANMVVRAIGRETAQVPMGRVQQTSGPFSTTYAEDVVTGDAVWLTKMDKLILSPYRCSDGISIPLVSERTATAVITDES